MLPPRGVIFPSDSAWNSLLFGLREVGHDVPGFGVSEGPYDALVAMNHQPLVGRVRSLHSIPTKRTALIILEPRVTSPQMYTKRALRQFGHRYAASPIWAERVGGRSFLWPQDIGPQQVSNGPRDFAAAMINGDKRSAVPGSLYGLRRQVIQMCQQEGVALAVFGPGWNATFRDRLIAGGKACLRSLTSGTIPRPGEALADLNQHPQYWFGTVEDKSAAFAVAPVGVVIENSLDYVSEKLVDAVRGGVAPLYVGPPLARFGLPENIAIALPPEPAGIVKALKAVSEDQVEEVISSGSEWLVTKPAQTHDIHHVLMGLGRDIGQKLRDS